MSPFDHGLTVGDGMFETMKVVGGAPFAAAPPPRPAAPLRRRARPRRARTTTTRCAPPSPTVIAANGPDARPGARHGHRRAGAARLGPRRRRPTVVIASAAGHARGRADRRVVTVPWPRNEHSAVAGLKTTSYAENVVALDTPTSAGADEAHLRQHRRAPVRGHRHQRLRRRSTDGCCTPPLSSGCLAGITRELRARARSTVDEVDLPMAALADADEAFLTSSTRDVQPIGSVDGSRLPRVPRPADDRGAPPPSPRSMAHDRSIPDRRRSTSSSVGRSEVHDVAGHDRRGAPSPCVDSTTRCPSSVTSTAVALDDARGRARPARGDRASPTAAGPSISRPARAGPRRSGGPVVEPQQQRDEQLPRGRRRARRTWLSGDRDRRPARPAGRPAS